jgi:two-component system KDP operon response regulator KdpE
MTKKVLIVEDDNDLRRGLGLRIKALGYDVAEAFDGYTAVAVARDTLPDVVLLDIGLPGGDGISVLERYAQMMQLSAIPVVVLTGRDPFVTEPLVRRYNVSAFLRKPADNEDLARALAAATEGDADAPAPPSVPAEVSADDDQGPSSVWFG